MREVFVSVRPSVPEDVEALIPNIPTEDNEDMTRGWGCTSAFMLRDIYPKCDECFSIIVTQAAMPLVVGMFGVMPGGNVWLMRGHGIDRVAIRFVRHGHEYLHRWLVKYGKLTGFINKNYKKFIRWLVWEGFEVTDLDKGYLMVTKGG